MTLLSYEERLKRFKETYKGKFLKKKGGKKAKKRYWLKTKDGRPTKCKKKRGPKKKPGPKVSWYKRQKRKREKLLKSQQPRAPKGLYKMIITNCGKQKEYINYYNTVESAVEAFRNMVEENKLLKFPIKYIKTKNKIHDANYELLLLKKVFDTDVIEQPKFRNELGILVDNIITTDDRWVIFDKAPYYYEESFWVYGYHPSTQRKNFEWIYENLIFNKMIGEKYDLFRMALFFNKILILDDYDDFSMVLCKNKSDAIRLYNLIITMAKKDKIKQLIEMGDVCTNLSIRKEIVKLIMDKTGWNKTKVERFTS